MLEKKLHLAQTRHISSMTGSGPIGSCRRVLVIVTDVDLREYIKGCLDGCRELDAGVLSARTRASLQKARLPDLIIADFGLLHAEAHACHPSLSECLKDCSVPLLLLTGLTGNGVRPGNRETPGISRLASPFNARRLHSAVYSLLTRSPRETDASADAAPLPLPDAFPFGLYEVAYGQTNCF